MSNNSDQRDWFDLILAAVNPALVMGLVGSLAFFLLDVAYRGAYEARLRWTMFFFVFGMVLVSRIALIMGSERGWLYGLLLGGATYLAAAKFTTGVGWIINVGIIAAIAASAYLLTRDTTWLPHRTPDRGLATELTNAWQLLPVDGPKRKGRHGIWVVYFSLTAVPMFALGQSLIPVAEMQRRNYAFWLMTVYVACGLSLLLTTALVNLRSYLKARNLSMPAAMTGAWVASGSILIVVALVVAALIPRPHSETPLVNFVRAGADEACASRVSPDSEAGGKGDGKPGGQNMSEGREGQSKRGKFDPNAKTKSDRGSGGEDGKDASDKGAGKNAKGAKGSEQGGDKSSTNSENSPSTIPPNFETISNLLTALAKWVIWILVGLAVVFLVIRNFANMSQTLRNWLEQLASLWHRKKRQDADLTSGTDDKSAIPGHSRSFVEFANPFSDSSADRREDKELVQYTFDALEAWARDTGQVRGSHETPLEFTDRLTAEIRPSAEKVAGLYSLITYRRTNKLPTSARDSMRALWDCLADQGSALSAGAIPDSDR